MGQGISVKCNKCGYSFDACTGVGMLFPSVYQENVEKMKRGELGQEGKEFFEKYPNGVINSEQAVAKCRKCGNYDIVDDLTMYKPKEGVKVPDEVAYIFEDDIKEAYEKYMDYPHVCSKCGGHTKVYKSFAKKAMKGELSCPKCDGFMMMDFSQMVMWD